MIPSANLTPRPVQFASQLARDGAAAAPLCPTPLLIPWNDVPRALSISRAHLARMRVAGKFGPTVLRAGRKLLIRADELRRWVDANMPDRPTWIAMEATGRRHTRAGS